MIKHIDKINKLAERANKIMEVGAELSLYSMKAGYDESDEMQEKIANTINELIEAKNRIIEEMRSTADELGAEIKSVDGKPLQQLKTDINNKDIKLKMVYNECYSPSKSKLINVVREIDKTQSNGLYLKNTDGSSSWLEYPKAREMKYMEKYLVIYNTLYTEKVNIIYEIIRED